MVQHIRDNSRVNAALYIFDVEAEVVIGQIVVNGTFNLILHLLCYFLFILHDFGQEMWLNSGHFLCLPRSSILQGH
jgi:hypothetical protein